MSVTRKVKTKNNRLIQALSYAKRGWPVHPLHGIVDGFCTCGKEDCSPGKHPILPNGLKGASTDPAQIRDWWKRCPKANIGIRTGAESGIVVLDIDPRNEGDKTLADLIKKHGDLPDTPIVNTGSGGQHYYFKHPGVEFKCGTDVYGQGLDVKGDGGCVVAPPSRHKSGGTYQWANGKIPSVDELAKMPDWMLNRKRRKSNRTQQQTGIIPEGQRNDTLASIAGKLRWNGLDETAILSALLDINANRCKPPLADDEVQRIAASVAKYPIVQSDGKDSQATELLQMAGDIELFHDPSNIAYAYFPVNDHQECWPVKSDEFAHWLKRRFFQTSGKAINAQAFQSALDILISKALYDGQRENVYLRVANKDDNIIIDLGDSEWRAVEISKDGWKVISAHPVRFTRTSTMQPLPVPQQGGSIDDLRKFVNIKSDEDFVLFVTWLSASLRPVGPYPLLVITGEQGSSKSTLGRLIKSLIDPQKPALRSLAKGEQDLMISVTRSWLLVFDNLSYVSPQLSDSLCRLSTGGGFVTRKLYTNTGEQVFEAMRPLVINGINDLIYRSDLLDRSICIVLPALESGQRLTEKEYWGNFHESHPLLLGAIFDVIATALSRLDSIEPVDLPRMADFAHWGMAAESAISVKEGIFIEAFENLRRIQNSEVIASSAIGLALVKFMNQEKFWSGTAQELLDIISKNEFSEWKHRMRKDWPKNARAMSSALRRLATNLRAEGIEVAFIGKTGKAGTRIIEIRQIEDTPPASPASPVKSRRVKVKRVIRK